MLRAIIFDCFGLFYVDPMKAFIEAQPPQMQPELTDLLLAYDRGVIGEQDLVKRLSDRSSVPTEVVRQSLYGPQLVRNQGLLNFAESLRPRYKVGLLSNLSPHTMDKYFTQEERQKYFDDVVVSSEVGLAKPEPEIYMLACQRLGVLSAEAVFIDDIPINVQAAIATGLQGIVYTNFAEVTQELNRLLQ